MDIRAFCRNLERLLATRSLQGDGLDTVIKAMTQGLGVNDGEIALIIADKKTAALRFLWPRGLQNSGTIPFTSKDSLAARTFQTLESTLSNNFSSMRHASIFEAFPLKEQAGKALSLQKIMSVPIRHRHHCLGVLQVCRKGVSQEECGPDFSREELLWTGLIARTLARQLLK